MTIVNLVFGGIVGVGMIVVSLLTALLMLEVYKLTSNQAAIVRAKDRIKAHLYEMRLYKDNMRVTLAAQGSIVKANLAYMGANLKPLAVMIVPLVLILAQLSVWYDRAPLRPGQETLVKAKLESTADPVAAGLDLEVPPGLEISAPAVRIADLHEVVWRVKALAPGAGRLTLRTGSATLEKSVVVGGGPMARVSAVASRGSFWKRVLYPGEAPLAAGASVRSVEILYPAKSLAAFGLNIHWLVAYLILSIAFGFAFKGVFKVEI
jgi:uncharacterized membrane protein (DUF106 family)